MPRPKLYTEQQRIQRRRESSLKWMRKNKDYVNSKSIEWAKKNPNEVNKIRKRSYAKHKNNPIYRLNRLWYFMISRCFNENDKRYSYYGGRGISVCEEWKADKECFIKWGLGSNYQLGLTIDRINNNGNYEPSNCHFATQKEQNNNRRDNVFIEYNGQKKTLAQWSEFYKIPKTTLWWRYKQGHSVEKIFYNKHLQSHKNLIDKYLKG